MTDFDMTQLEPRDRYRLLINLVGPRPIALVTSESAETGINAAPFSFFNLVGSDPPLVVLGIGDRQPGEMKDTATNAVEMQEFVVNLVDEELLEAMNICAIDFPPGFNELQAAGLTTEASLAVKPPRIAEAPASLECRLVEMVQVRNSRVLVGEVVHLHVRDGLVVDMRVQTDKLHMVGRLFGGGGYVRTTDTIELPRISYSEWQKENSPNT